MFFFPVLLVSPNLSVLIYKIVVPSMHSVIAHAKNTVTLMKFTNYARKKYAVRGIESHTIFCTG